MLICCPIHLVMENCFCKRNRDRPKRHGPDCLRHIGQIFSTGGGEGKLSHDGGILRAGDGGKNVGKSGQEPVTQKSKRHRFFGVAAQPQILLGAHVDAMGAKPPCEGGQKCGIVASTPPAISSVARYWGRT